jgi:hypothetical protein
MRLFRGMKEEAVGLPAVGPSGRMLGVRPGDAPTPDVLAIDPTDLVQPGQGGMSVAPGDPRHLQRHRRPPSLGGTGQDPVWWIEDNDLGPDLIFRQDRATHGLIEASRPMSLQELQDALAATRPRWRLYCR